MCIHFYISLYIRSEYADVLQNGLPVIKWPEIVEDDIEGDEAAEVQKKNTYLLSVIFYLSFNFNFFLCSDFSFLFCERILDKLIRSSNTWRLSNRC